MPLPTPNSGETQSAFVSRCVGSDVVQRDFKDNKQRVAVCYSQWRKTKKEIGGLDNISYLTLSKHHFPKMADAAQWVEEAGLGNSPLIPMPYDYLIALCDERFFIKDSLRSIHPCGGIEIVYGFRKAEDKGQYIQKAFNQDKPLNEATLGEYSEAMHT